MADTESKRCRKCGLEKTLADFHNDRRTADGKYPYCKSCTYTPLPKRELECAVCGTHILTSHPRATLCPSRECYRESRRLSQATRRARPELRERMLALARQSDAKRASARSGERRSYMRAYVGSVTPESRFRAFTRLLLRLYGLSREQFDNFLVAQSGCCAICGSAFGAGRKLGPHVDHDHSSGIVRGLLCIYCNSGIGSFRDSTNLMRAAISYIDYR